MSVPPTASGELLRGRSPGGWGALADWLARQVADGAEVHPARFEGAPGWRYVAEQLGPPGMYSRTIRMPTYGDAASPLTRSRQHQEDREPATTSQPGCCPAEAAGGSPDRSERQAACAAAEDVHLARIAPKPRA
ncbi:MAG TPA: hypothetical protein VJN19_01445 [Propionibacteriaceae bacterium]|nr:hypothetical protein [Propionibacteriaceae bacterium]